MSYLDGILDDLAKEPLRFAQSGVQAAPTLVSPPPEFSKEQIETLKEAATQLPEEVQTALLSAAAEKRTTLGRPLTTQEAAATIHATLLEQGNDPLALNAMSATPTGLEFAQAAALQEQAHEAGLSTINSDDIERLTQRAEALTTQMMAQGAKDGEILQAVANLPGYTMETAAPMRAKVDQLLDADKFNMLSNRNAPEATTVAAPLVTLAVATPETAAPENPSLAAALGLQAVQQQFSLDEQQRRAQLQHAVGAVSAAPVVTTALEMEPATPSPQNPYGVTAARMPVMDMGQTTAALAAMGQFAPQADLPNLNTGRGRDTGFQLA